MRIRTTPQQDNSPPYIGIGPHEYSFTVLQCPGGGYPSGEWGSISLSIYLLVFICISIYLSIYLSIYIYLYIYISIYLSI